MNEQVRNIPSLSNRIAEGRPVLGQNQVVELSKRVMDMTSADTASITVTHTARVITRMANGQVLSSDDGDELLISLATKFGDRNGVYITTNQLDGSVLRSIVDKCESLARQAFGYDRHLLPYQKQVQDTFTPVALWHGETIQAMSEARETVIPDLLSKVNAEGLNGSGFLGLMARSESILTKEGISAYNEETDCELTVTARHLKGKSSGWDGQAARNWAQIRPNDVTARAIEIAKRGVNPVALEPGRRTAILSQGAMIQIARWFNKEFDALETDTGRTAFSRTPSGNKLKQRVFDTRINMSSDPQDAEGGYRPYFESGHASRAMRWVENGVLKNLAYNPGYAMVRGKPYSRNPESIRISGGATLLEQMIAKCQDGIFVNRFSDVDLVNLKTGLMTGVTRDGCFYIKDGKISHPIKNFRFMDSPFFFLNNVEALGVTGRGAYGYTPPSFPETGEVPWPRPPVIVPPVMVRDFNFSALSNAI